MRRGNGLLLAMMVLVQITNESAGQAASAKSATRDVRLTFRDIGPETGYSGSGSGFTFNSDTRQVILPTARRIFRSANGGNTWSPLDFAVATPTDIRAGLPQAYTAGSAFVRQDPNNRRILYAVASEGGELARSDDFGTTWRQLEDANPGRIYNFADIAVHEASSNVLLALRKIAWEIEGPPLWRSEDGGVTFTPQLHSGLPVETFDSETDEGCDPFYSNIATTPADPNVVYVAQVGGDNAHCPAAIHKSIDGGRTFVRLEASGRGIPIQVFPHPTRPGVLFVQTADPTNSSIHRSLDGGATFQLVTGNLPVQNFFVSFDRHQPSLVYVAGRSGVFRSQDGGDTFQPLGLTSGQLGRFATNVAVDPSDSKVVYVNTWNGNFKSANGGATFHAINNGWRAAVVRTIGFDHASDPNLYLATDHGIYRTHTRGHDFERVPHPSILDNTRELVFAPSDPKMILAAVAADECCFDRLYRTVDGGQSWIEARVVDDNQEPVSLDSIIVDPHDSNNVYLIARLVCVPTTVGPPSCEPKPSNGLYKSVDAGATFELLFPTDAFSALALDPIRPNRIFNLGPCGITGCPFPIGRSIDGGLSFLPASGPVQFDAAFPARILLDPHRENHLLLVGSFVFRNDPLVVYNIVRSTDGGATFLPVRAAGLGDGCHNAVFDPKVADQLYCVANGIYSTSDSGETWSSAPADGIAKLKVLTVSNSPKKPKLLYLLGSSLLEVEIHD